MFDAVQSLALWLIWALMLGVKAFALYDCVRQPAPAFPAVGRQTKPLWLVLVGLALLIGLLPSQTFGLLGIASVVIALVYLFDVRPKVLDITGR